MFETAFYNEYSYMYLNVFSDFLGFLKSYNKSSLFLTVAFLHTFVFTVGVNCLGIYLVQL